MKQFYQFEETKSLLQLFYGVVNSEATPPLIRLHAELNLQNIFMTQNMGKGPPYRKRTLEKVHSVFWDLSQNATLQVEQIYITMKFKPFIKTMKHFLTTIEMKEP